MLLDTEFKFWFEPPPRIGTILPSRVAKHDYILVQGNNFIMEGVKSSMRCRFRLRLYDLRSAALVAKLRFMNANVDEVKVPAEVVSEDLLRCSLYVLLSLCLRV